MKIDWQKAGIKKLAAIISTHLQKNGIEVVLVYLKLLKYAILKQINK
jgi:hypothetical protein